MSTATLETLGTTPLGTTPLGITPLGVALDDELPCRVADADLWFAENPAELERAKALCGQCPVRSGCLRTALDRAEPWGVWGGEIFDHGEVVARKRSRGRPRKDGSTVPRTVNPA